MATAPEPALAEDTNYRRLLTARAQSIHAGIQQLEDLGATAEDDYYAQTAHFLNEADDAVAGLVDWIANGRP